MKSQIMITLFASLVASSSAATCVNPVFDPTTQSKFGSVSWQGSIKLTLTESAPFPAGGKICKAFAGQQSCCDASMLDAISAANDAVGAALVVSEKAWESIDFTPMTQGLKTGCGLMAILFPDKAKTCNDELTKGSEAFKQSLDQVVQENLKCAKGMQAYGLGMACFACKADAIKYVDSTKEIVKLAQNTCNSVFNNCAGVFTSYTNLVKQTIALVNSIVKQFASITFELNWETDLCKGSSCQDYVCNTLLNGVAAQLPNVQMPTSRRRLEVTVHGNVRAEHVPLVEAVQAQLKNLEKAVLATTDAVQKHPGQNARRALVEAANQADAELAAPAASRILATSSHSSYSSSGGYDPYAVGCKDIECPSGGMTTVIIVVVAAVCAVALLIGVGAFVMRRGKAQGAPEAEETVV